MHTNRYEGADGKLGRRIQGPNTLHNYKNIMLCGGMTKLLITVNIKGSRGYI